MYVGLTGGIGSGKSTVAGYFGGLGVPVYNSDLRARELMEQDASLREGIVGLLGMEAYKGEKLNRPYIAAQVFAQKHLLNQLNALVHPAVREDFRQWTARQHAPYVIQEAAILIENGAYRELDRLILVTAPKGERIKRVIRRDCITEQDVLARMNNQWEDEEKISLADFVIHNTDLATTQQQVREIHRVLLETATG